MPEDWSKWETRQNYLVIGDLDKTFHRPECECDDCESWRVWKGRPTHKEIRGEKKDADRYEADHETPDPELQV